MSNNPLLEKAGLQIENIKLMVKKYLTKNKHH